MRSGRGGDAVLSWPRQAISTDTGPPARHEIERPDMWIRGFTFEDCDTAIELVGEAIGATLIGTNSDNFNDNYEAVVYEQSRATSPVTARTTHACSGALH